MLLFMGMNLWTKWIIQATAMPMTANSSIVLFFWLVKLGSSFL